MKSHTELPPTELPLRAKLPAMREETREALLAWALAQPGAIPWLLNRAAWYWMQLGSDPPPILTGAETQAERGQTEAMHRRIEAVVALDLLKWRTESGDDRGAVAHLADLKAHAALLETKA